jgi:hypothetical protein
MAAETAQLGLVTPTQGDLTGTWGNVVNNGITEYVNIAVAGTLTLTGDGAVTLANTTGNASVTNITATLAGAGTVTAQFAAIRVTGTSTTKVITGPSYSKTYVVDNASSYAVTFKAAGETGVSIAAGEKALVFFNSAASNADYIKVASSLLSALTGVVGPANGGTGVANNAASTLTISGNFPTTFTVGASTSLTLPSSGSLGYLNIPQSGAAKTTSYTLALGDIGEFIEVGASGSIVVPDATFSAGDAVVIFNNTSGAITLTMSITTAYIGGTDADKATISLATRGVCNVLFISGTVCVVTGNVT